jgi:hypothetical protein
MLDKILLLLLVVLLPVGVVASKQLFQPQLTNQATADANVKKVEDLINSLNQKSGQNVTAGTNPNNQIPITAVIYASDSAVLQVAGMAPQGKYLIWANVSLIPQESIPEINQTVAKDNFGLPTVTKAIEPRSDGSFVFDYPVRDNQGMVEISLSQGSSFVTIQYDLVKQKRIE